MSPNELDRAIVALRERHDGQPPAGVRTEARILELLEKRQPVWKKLRWGFPLAAAFAVSSAWAAVHPEVVVSTVKAWLTPERGSVEQKRVAANPLSRREATAVSAAATVAAPLVSTAPEKIAMRQPGGLPQVASAVGVSASPANQQEEAASPLEIYRTASRLHFAERNPAAALVAWESYIAADPHGPLVLEARYYRAICLVELGRTAEAEAVLRPFAEGQYGSYRQAEARQALQQLAAVTE